MGILPPEPKLNRGDQKSYTMERVRRELIQITEEVADQRNVEVAKLTYAIVTGESPGRILTCDYVQHDEPACLIGHWLNARAFISIATLRRHENEGAIEVCEQLLPHLPERARTYLQAVQDFQDAGHTWLYAIEQGYGETIDVFQGEN